MSGPFLDPTNTSACLEKKWHRRHSTSVLWYQHSCPPELRRWHHCFLPSTGVLRFASTHRDWNQQVDKERGRETEKERKREEGGPDGAGWQITSERREKENMKREGTQGDTNKNIMPSPSCILKNRCMQSLEYKIYVKLNLLMLMRQRESQGREKTKRWLNWKSKVAGKGKDEMEDTADSRRIRATDREKDR